MFPPVRIVWLAMNVDCEPPKRVVLQAVLAKAFYLPAIGFLMLHRLLSDIVEVKQHS